ncbi:MAG: hypothetical protein V2I27_12515 [Erythrobacter sp.]|nr:hypothetical protein [Erythrobacter sp.]
MAAPLAAQTGDASQDEAAKLTDGEKRLAKMLEGRVAGEPQSCLRTLPAPHVTVIDETAIVYGRGSTIWVQRTADPESIDRDDVISVRQFRAGQMCRADLVTTSERYSGIFTGTVMLEDFIPYRKVDAKES